MRNSRTPPGISPCTNRLASRRLTLGRLSLPATSLATDESPKEKNSTAIVARIISIPLRESTSPWSTTLENEGGTGEKTRREDEDIPAGSSFSPGDAGNDILTGPTSVRNSPACLLPVPRARPLSTPSPSSVSSNGHIFLRPAIIRLKLPVRAVPRKTYNAATLVRGGVYRCVARRRNKKVASNATVECSVIILNGGGGGAPFAHHRRRIGQKNMQGILSLCQRKSTVGSLRCSFAHPPCVFAPIYIEQREIFAADSARRRRYQLGSRWTKGIRRASLVEVLLLFLTE